MQRQITAEVEAVRSRYLELDANSASAARKRVFTDLIAMNNEASGLTLEAPERRQRQACGGVSGRCTATAGRMPG